MSQGKERQAPCLPGPSISSPPGITASEAFAVRFADLYRQEKPRLLRFFLRRLGDRAEADDLAQETLARFFKAAAGQEVMTPQAYLTRIVTNMLQDRAAHSATALARSSIPLDQQMVATDAIDAHREAAGREALARWRAILARLAPLTLEIFLLNRIEGYSYRAIATMKDLPLWAVQKHMLRAIRHITVHQDAEDA
jgi:RNA polymerase sigma-70 factor (ECF subfamily)